MTRLKLLALLPMAISTVAFAAGESTGSEYMHQTAASKWEVTPMIEYHDWSINSYGTGANVTKTELTGMSYGVKGEYGINDMFSAGIKLNMVSDSSKFTLANGGTTTNGKFSGMSNIDIYGLGKSDGIFGGTLRYGLDLALSLGKHTIDNSGTSQAVNEDTGGTNLTPFIGWEMAMGPGVLGAKFSYSFLLSDRSIDLTAANGTVTNIKENGVSAQSLAVFYEWMQNNWSLGLAVSYNGVTGTKDAVGGAAAVSNDSGHAGLAFNVYAPIMVADSITLIPQFTLGDNGTQYSGMSQVTTVTGWDLGVAARFAF